MDKTISEENISNDNDLISPENTSAALDFILSNTFKSGFGTLSKTEMDLILFTAVLKYSEDGKKSDIALSKYLQITQQRIKNLKEKASVKYLSITRYEAIEQFIAKCEHAKIEENFIDIPVNDIAIKNEIEGMLDEEHILMHYQLNPKIFRLRIDDFYEFMIVLELFGNKKANRNNIEEIIISSIKKKSNKAIEFRSKLETKGWNLTELSGSTLKQALVKGGFSLGIDLLASIVPGGTFVSGHAKSLLEKISAKI